MELLNKALALVCVVVIATLTPVAIVHEARGLAASKFADVSDHIATTAYLDAEYRWLLSIKNGSTVTVSAIANVINTADQCPRVASGVPYGSQRREGIAWVADIIGLAVVRSEIGIDSRFRKAVIRLRWSDPSIALLVAANLHKLRRETAVKMPALCQDLGIWVNDAFRRAPAQLSRFVREFDGLSEGEDKVPAALKRFELPRDKVIVRAIDHDKSSVDRAVRHDLWVGQERLLGVLGL